MKDFYKKPIFWIIVLAIIIIYGYNTGWFNVGTGYVGGKGFPKNPKVGDKFNSLNDGKEYTYVCIDDNQGGIPVVGGVKCFKYGWLTDEQIKDRDNLPLPGRFADPSFAQGGQTGRSSMPQIFGARHSSPTTKKSIGIQKTAPSKLCWSKDWTDAINRHYHFEIWATNCNALYVSDAQSLITQALADGKLNGQYTLSNNTLLDIVNNIYGELNMKYHPEVNAGLMSFKVSGNGVWAGGTAPISLPIQCDPKHPGYDVNGVMQTECGAKPHKLNLYLVTEDNNKHTAILRSSGPIPTQLKVGQKIDVTLLNPWKQEPNRNYKATIMGFTNNPMEIVTDIPFLGLTNLPPNTIPTMGPGYIMY